MSSFIRKYDNGIFCNSLFYQAHRRMKFRVYSLRVKEKAFLESVDIKGMKRIFCISPRWDTRELISEVFCSRNFSLLLDPFHRSCMKIRRYDTKFTCIIINDPSHQSDLHKKIFISRKISDIAHFLVFDIFFYLMYE